MIYNHRPLPYIIGTEAFLLDDHAGMNDVEEVRVGGAFLFLAFVLGFVSWPLPRRPIAGPTWRLAFVDLDMHPGRLPGGGRSNGGRRVRGLQHCGRQ